MQFGHPRNRGAGMITFFSFKSAQIKLLWIFLEIFRLVKIKGNRIMVIRSRKIETMTSLKDAKFNYQFRNNPQADL